MKRDQTYGPRCLTRRYTDVDGDGVAISFPEHSVKSVQLHVEGSTVVSRIEGNTTFTGSGIAIFTSDGATHEMDIGVPPGDTLFTWYPPVGTSKTLEAEAAVDNEDGTVNIPCDTHGFVENDVVQISGTDNYDAVYTLPAQTNGDADNFVITATYAAETFAGTEVAYELTGGTKNISVVAMG